MTLKFASNLLGYSGTWSPKTASKKSWKSTENVYQFDDWVITDDVIWLDSAPTSPAKGQHSQNQAGSHSMVSQVQGLTRNLFQVATGHKQPAYNKDRCKCLLVIDNANTDWSKYFRSKKILGEFEIRVEQAEFPEISLASYSDSGCLVDLNVLRSGTKVTRSLQPDFVLIRSPVKTETHDWRKIVIGLLFGGVPSLNSLHSVYNFLDKPWVFAHLLMINRRIGKEKFPLIDQVYYPSFREITPPPKFPVVVKIGHGTKGAGKIKVNSSEELQDISSVVAVTGQDCTAEPFIDSKYDIHIQKIGTAYKAFMRKGISGHWKANLGSAMLEQIAMTDRYKLWVDEIAQLFGGLDICSVEAIVGKDGREIIYEANDCSMTLLGETQEEDRRLIAELALQKMNHILGVKQALIAARSGGPHQSPQPHGQSQRTRSGSESAGPQRQPPPSSHAPPQPGPRPSPGPLRQGPPSTQHPSQAPQQSQRQPPQGGLPGPDQQPPSGHPSQAGHTGQQVQPGLPGQQVHPGHTGKPGQVPASGPPPVPPPPRPRQPSLTKEPSKDSLPGGKPIQSVANPGIQQSGGAGTNPFIEPGVEALPPQSGQPGTSGQAGNLGQQANPGQAPGQPGQPGHTGQPGEDTMTNLRKTFAGIFGDM